MKLYLRPYHEREAAKRELAEVLELNANAIEVVAMREREIEILAAQLRAAKEGLDEARATADECERVLGRAVDEYRRAHVPATSPEAMAAE